MTKSVVVVSAPNISFQKTMQFQKITQEMLNELSEGDIKKNCVSLDVGGNTVYHFKNGSKLALLTHSEVKNADDSIEATHLYIDEDISSLGEIVVSDIMKKFASKKNFSNVKAFSYKTNNELLTYSFLS